MLIILISPAMAVCDGYAKKAPIEINTSTAATDYQLFMNVTYDSDMQADFDDLCFTNEEEDTELDYFLEDKTDSSWAGVWVEVDSIDTSNGTQAWIYYGKVGASSSSSATGVFGSSLVSLISTHGNALDVIGSMDGSVSGAILAKDKENREGYSYYFDGVNDYIGFTDTYSNEFTWDLWVYKNATGTAGRVLNMDDGSSHRCGYIMINADDTLNMQIRDSGGGWHGDTSYSFGVPGWHHLTVTHNTTNMSAYIDGSLEATWGGSFTYRNEADCPFELGIRSLDSNSPFKGRMGSFRVYNTALTATEIAKFNMANEPDYGFGAEESSSSAPTINLYDPQNQTYYGSSIPYNITTDDPEGNNYDCNVSYDGSVIDTLSEADESATGNIASADGYHNLSVYCLDATGSDSNNTVYFTVWSGFNISVTYGNGTAATNWNISVTNGTSNYTDTTLSNPTLIRWDDLPVGSINITVDDGSDTLYYFQNTTSKTNNNTNFETISFTIYEKAENTIVLTSSPGWSVTETNSVTISCSASEGTPSLYRDGVFISNPYSSTLTQGSYTIVCNTTETENYQPTQAYHTLQITSPYGCYDNETFAFSVTISTTTNLTTINLTDQVEQHLIKPDLSDIYAPNVTETWINLTDGYYVVTNNTDLTEFSIYFGNYPVSRSYSSHDREGDLVSVSTYSQENSYYQIDYYEEISNKHRLINATLQVRVECSLGANYFALENETILIASEYDLTDVKTIATYSPTEVYSRSLIPEGSSWYSKFYMVDEVQVTQTKMTLIDYSRDFIGAKLSIKKQMEGLQRVMTEGYLDSENKLIVYLALEENYQIYLDNGDEIRGIGLLYADSVQQEKSITLYQVIGFVPNQTDFNMSLYYDTASETINFYIYDPTADISLVEFYVYNFSSNDLLFSASSENRSIVSFVYAVPDNETNYKTRVVIHQGYMGYNTTVKEALFDLASAALNVPNPFNISDFEGNLSKYCLAGGGDCHFNSANFLFTIFLIGIALMFSALEGAYGGIACSIMAMLGYALGWYTITATLLALSFFFAVMNLMREGS